jgi:uncharacterized protein
MAHDWFRRNSPHMQKLFRTLLIMFACLLVTVLLSIVLSSVFFHKSTGDILASLSNPENSENLNIMRFMQVLQSIGLFILPPFILLKMYGEPVAKWLKIDKSPGLHTSFYVILIMVVAIPVINLLGTLNAAMQFPHALKGIEDWMRASEVSAQKLTELFLSVTSYPGFIFNIFMMAILPAIGEELIFRGLLQRIFTDWTNSIHWGIIISATIFSAIHFQFFGFIPRFLLGVLFGYLLAWSGSLWLPIIAHFLNNMMAVTYYFFYNQQAVGKQIETIGTTRETYIFSIISAIILSGLLFVFYRKTKTDLA